MEGQIKVGVIGGDSRRRYQDIRDNSLGTGKTVEAVQFSDLDKFFNDRYITSISPTVLKKFREWRENKPEVVEYKNETLQKEIQLRKVRASENWLHKLRLMLVIGLRTESKQPLTVG